MRLEEKTQTNICSPDTKASSNKNIHIIFAYSYIFYFTALLLGVFFDFIFPYKFFDQSIMTPVGFVLLVLSSVLILWAQRTLRDFKKETVTKEAFCHGPYYFTRTPTYFGLFLLILSFGFIVNATFVILFSVISFFITKSVFSRKEELILVDKYGTPYLEYKKLFRF
ncbi:MAG: methyltransferase [Minisyncoccia bacterium]